VVGETPGADRLSTVSALVATATAGARRISVTWVVVDMMVVEVSTLVVVEVSTVTAHSEVLSRDRRGPGALRQDECNINPVC
jgi:hypothetical protein